MRHKWSWVDGVDREKHCEKCGMVARRFGIGRDSYWDYRLGDFYRVGGNVPTCNKNLVQKLG